VHARLALRFREDIYAHLGLHLRRLIVLLAFYFNSVLDKREERSEPESTRQAMSDENCAFKIVLPGFAAGTRR
jgi:hypothetical protein